MIYKPQCILFWCAGTERRERGGREVRWGSGFNTQPQYQVYQLPLTTFITTALCTLSASKLLPRILLRLLQNPLCSSLPFAVFFPCTEIYSLSISDLGNLVVSALPASMGFSLLVYWSSQATMSWANEQL